MGPRTGCLLVHPYEPHDEYELGTPTFRICKRVSDYIDLNTKLTPPSKETHMTFPNNIEPSVIQKMVTVVKAIAIIGVLVGGILLIARMFGA